MSARVQTASQKPEGHSSEGVTVERRGGGRGRERVGGGREGGRVRGRRRV